MKKRFTYFAIIGLLVFYLLFFYNSSVSQVDDLIDSFATENRVFKKPNLGTLSQWSIHIDSYTHDCSRSDIQRLYKKAKTKLKKSYKGQQEIIKYSWEDSMTYPREALVIQFMYEGKATNYLIARYSSNNDNDAFTFEYKEGSFDIKESPESDNYQRIKNLTKQIEP